MKSFFSKLGVLLLGATFAVVGCTDFAEDIREVNESLKTEIDNNQSTADVSIKALEDAIAALEAKMAAEYATKEAVSQIETSLKNDCLAKFNDLSGKLEAAKLALTSDIATAKQEAIAEAQKAVEEAKTAAQSLVSNLDTKLSGEIALVNSAVAALEKDLDAAEKTLALKADKTYVDDQVIAAKTTLTNEINTVKADLDAAETLLNTVKSDLDKAEVKVDANAASIAQNVADIKKNADAIAAANGLIATAQANITALQGQVSALDTKLAEEVGKLQVKIDANASEITALKTKMEAAEKKIENIIADYLTKADFNAYKKEVADTYASKAELKQAVDGLNTALDNYKKDVAATYATKTELADVKKNLEDADDALAKNLDDFKKAVADTYATKVELAGLKSDLEKAIEDCGAAAQKALDDSVAVVRTLVADVKKALEDQMAADKKELTEKIEKVETDLTTMVNDLDTKINGRIDSEVLTLNEKIDNSVKVLNKTIEDVKAELEKKIADEKKALQDELMAAKEELNKAISKNATDIASLQDSIAAHTAARLALAAKHASDVADLQSQITNHINAYTIKVAALDAEDLAIRKAFADADVALEGKVTEAYKKAIDEAKTAILKQHNEDKKALETSIAALEAADVKLNTRIDSLKTALDTYKTTMEGIVNDLNTDIAQTLTDAKNYADDQISAAETALQANIDQVVIDYKAADDALQGQIDVIDGRLDGIDDSIADIIEDIKGINDSLGDITGRLDGIDGEIDGIQGDIEAIQKDIDSLFNRIQSIVFRPEYHDGKAHIDYATIGGAILEGSSVITYKVYPADCAETIVKAFDPNATELVLSYDLINDLKGSTPEGFKVLSVTSPKKGEIAVTVQPNNFVEAFYTSADTRYAAALVLSRGNDHYSTEYTNLVANAPKTYGIVLENNTAKHSTLEYPQVKDSVIVLDGIVAKFQSGSEPAITTEDFFKMYPAAEAKYSATIETVVSPSSEAFKAPTYTDEGELVVKINPGKVSSSNKNVVLTATYKYALGSEVETAADDVTIIDFTYKNMVVASAGNGETVYIPYTSSDVKPIMADYTVKFNDDKTIEDLVEMGYAVKVNTLDPATTLAAKVPNVPEFPDDDALALFDVTADVPVNVSLAQSGGLNKAVGANVGTTINVEYGFKYETLTGEVIDTEAINSKVEIDKIHYSYTIEYPLVEWAFTPDAGADKDAIDHAIDPYCTRDFVLAINDALITPSPEVPADQNIEKVLSDIDNIKLSVNGGAPLTGADWGAFESPIEFEDMAADNGEINVQMRGLAWNKTYNVVAVIDRPSAKVTINFKVETKDRKREPLVIELGDVTEKFNANYILKSEDREDKELWLAKNLINGGYLGKVAENPDTTALLNDVLDLAEATNYTVSCASAAGYTGTDAISTGLKFVDFTKVDYVFHYGNLTNKLGFASGATMDKSYDYSASFKTFYGQEVKVNLGFNFADPEYHFAKVHQYVMGDANNLPYYVDVQPSYKKGGVGGAVVENNTDPIDYFSTKQINLDAAFIVQGEGLTYDPENAAAYETEITNRGLIRKFVVNPYVDDIDFNFGTNKLNYNGSEPYAKVQGSLSIMNTYDNGGTFYTYYPIDKNVYDVEDYFTTFQVNKFDPLGDLTVIGNVEKEFIVNKSGVFTLHVLHNFSMKDKRIVGEEGHEIISSAEDANAFVTGDDYNGFVSTVSAYNVYNFEYIKYNISVVDPVGVTVAGISYNNTDGTITIKNDGELVYANPVVLKVEVAVKYPQTEEKKASYNLTIKK